MPVQNGIAQAGKEGRPHGRPRPGLLKGDEVRRLEAERMSCSEVAWPPGIGRMSVRRMPTAV
jgi:hypothetical protein